MGSGDDPGGVVHGLDQGLTQDGAAVEEPDGVLAGVRPAPDDVGAAVAVEVAGADDLPAEVGLAVDDAGLAGGGAVEKRERDVAVQRVAPQQVAGAPSPLA